MTVESLDTASLRVTWSNPEGLDCISVGNLQYLVSWSESIHNAPYVCELMYVYECNITGLPVSGGQYIVTVGSNVPSTIAETSVTGYTCKLMFCF